MPRKVKYGSIGVTISPEDCIEVFEEIAQPPDLKALYHPFTPPRKTVFVASRRLDLYYREMLIACVYRFTSLQKIQVARMFHCGLIDVARALHLITDKLEKAPKNHCSLTAKIFKDIEFAIRLRFPADAPQPLSPIAAKKTQEFVDYGFPVKFKYISPLVLEVLKSRPHHRWKPGEILNVLSEKHNIVGPVERKRWSQIIGPCLQKLEEKKAIKKRFERKGGNQYRYSYQYQLK